MLEDEGEATWQDFSFVLKTCSFQPHAGAANLTPAKYRLIPWPVVLAAATVDASSSFRIASDVHDVSSAYVLVLGQPLRLADRSE
jgi:hypothetical protein